jgi:hypothetical protein
MILQFTRSDSEMKKKKFQIDISSLTIMRYGSERRYLKRDREGNIWKHPPDVQTGLPINCRADGYSMIADTAGYLTSFTG